MTRWPTSQPACGISSRSPADGPPLGPASIDLGRRIRADCKRPAMSRGPAAARVHLARAEHRETSPNGWEVSVGRFLLGFLVAIVIVIFVAVQCAQALF